MPRGNTKKSNFPNAQIDDMNGTEVVGMYVESLLELSNKGRPKNIKELKDRINAYFNYCAQKCLRPGIEGLCLSLSTNRMTFWNWCNGTNNYGSEWVDTCLQARQLINSFLELTATHGRLNPTLYIFMAKNWMGYDDRQTIESIGMIQEDRTYKDFDNINKYRLLPMFEGEDSEESEQNEKS